MAPEIARGRAGDTRSDVFSLGVILREMLIGPRFPSTLSEAQALEHARDGFVPTTFLELQLPKEVRSIMARVTLRSDDSALKSSSTSWVLAVLVDAATTSLNTGR